jgi:hypothetical protein
MNSNGCDGKRWNSVPTVHFRYLDHIPVYARLPAVYLTVQGRRMVLGKKLVQAGRDVRYWLSLSLGVFSCVLVRLRTSFIPRGPGVWFFRNINRLIVLQTRLGLDSAAP